MIANPMPPQYRAGVGTMGPRTLTTATYQLKYLRSVAPATNQVTHIRSDDLVTSHVKGWQHLILTSFRPNSLELFQSSQSHMTEARV